MKSIVKITFLVIVAMISFSAGRGNYSKPVLKKTVKDSLGFKIDSTEAYKALIEYKDYIDGVQVALVKSDSLRYHDDKNKLNYGVGVKLMELRQVLWNSKYHPLHGEGYIDKDSLFLMNAIRDDKGKEVTEIIFALKCYDESTGAYDSTWKFFDFTRPCPTSCPGFLNYNESN